MSIHALFLNCSLKKSSEGESNTDALIKEVSTRLEQRNISSETVRIADYQVAYGVVDDAGDGDEWPQIIEKIKKADIVVIGTPIWMGEKSSIATKVMERINGSVSVTNKKGQPIYYNKVGGVVVTGNEDGAKHAISSILFGLSYNGFTMPPETVTYWVGEAGPGPSFIEAEGYKHEFTMEQVKKMVHHLDYFARLHQQHEIPVMEDE
ncbi:flavodoxin family protein [Alkalicoccobacillus porphyridii]|uniref:Flavodoxin family protein n=1 Tax=Alkalicoccobacillus porphyridii TaxID=2597270 RepID=A0A553ZTL9_9BACI|nr:flavodoxin family protein [Alkalicoccobacillus porphyridii]TSB44814.1 flavodoxin family protein [Alkalicoccobacillus porphyridii]